MNYCNFIKERFYLILKIIYAFLIRDNQFKVMNIRWLYMRLNSTCLRML